MLFRGLCLVSLLAFAFSLLAQVNSATRLETPDFIAPAATISTTVDEVNLAFTVTDKHGRFISNLGPNDFRLLDNHQAPERLTFFQQRTGLPLHLAVVIDASASVAYRFKFETNAAAEFLRKILRPKIDQATVIVFNEHVSTAAEPSDDYRKLRAALKTIQPDGNTDLHDAVIYACDKLRRLPEHEITRKAIVLISDGVDTVHRATLQAAEQEASGAQVMIFSLTTNFSQDDANSEGDAVLRQLAASTGGALLAAHDEGRLDYAFRQLEKTLRNQYVLAYNPHAFEPDGSYRTVELSTLKSGLRTTCRRGYYARPFTH